MTYGIVIVNKEDQSRVEPVKADEITGQRLEFEDKENALEAMSKMKTPKGSILRLAELDGMNMQIIVEESHE